MTRTALIIATVAAALLSGSVAQAAPDSETVQVKVSYADLNLATPNGVAALHERIDAASKSACSYLSSDSTLDGVAQYKACRKDYAGRIEGSIAMPVRAEVASTEAGQTAH